MRRRILSGVLTVVVASCLTTFLAGRFTPLNVLAWAIFFSAIFGPHYLSRRRMPKCGPVPQ